MLSWFGRLRAGISMISRQAVAAIPAACLWSTLASVADAQPLAAAADARVRIGFSNLVMRLDSDEIGFAKAEYRVQILQALRAAGYNAVGAESLVFNRDEGEQADVVLGGTVRELECKAVGAETNCRVGIEWELLDRERDTVVYRLLARHAEVHIERKNDALTAKRLTLGALQELLAHGRFRQLLSQKRDTLPSDDGYLLAGFRACSSQERQLPAQFDEVANATFVVKQADGFGSGFAISPDGLVLTAAHVVGGKSVQLLRHGDSTPIDATVVRMFQRYDVALLALPHPSGQESCVDVQVTPPDPGDDVYAIGSPASQELAFSLTRGIVSGLRLMKGVQLVQTDASLNPGNSGGPLLDRHARVLGVVTHKLAGRAIEGLGFAVQIQEALSGLKLQPESSTSAELLQAAVFPADRHRAATAFVDTPSPVPSLDPEGDRRRADAADLARREEEQQAATPWYVKPMRGAGLSVALTGSLFVVHSWISTNNTAMKRAAWQGYRTENDIGWALLGLGGTAFVVSYPLQPKLAPKVGKAAARRLSIGLGPTTLAARVEL